MKTFSRLNKAGLIVLDSAGRTVLAKHEDSALVPASTTKLATAWLALEHWGEDHRFRTDFYWDEITRTLWVKGSGDPYLITEELKIVARNLKARGLRKVDAIGLDTSLFTPGLVLPGNDFSNNPYDAVPSAVAANFNTISIKKSAGKVRSANSRTPLTPYAITLSSKIRSGAARINTGPNPHNAERYFAELLAAMLRNEGVSVGKRIVYGPVPDKLAVYSHVNSRTLGEIVRNMLKYSTNFIANQLVLMLSAEAYRRPANAADVQRYMEETLFHSFTWKNFSMVDGAGLSRMNRLSPQQLAQLLHAFLPWKHLLPKIEPGIYAKTGTLTGVSTLAGYLVDHGEWRIFALLMNEKPPYRLRNRVAHELLSERSTNIVSLNKTP